MSRAWAAALALALAGCATSSAFRAGQKAERREEFDRAVLEYAKAVQESPDNLEYKRSLERARLRSSQEHAFAARRLASRALYKEALDELRLALDLNPGSETLRAETHDLEQRRNAAATGETIQQVKDRVREGALPGLTLGPGADEPLGLTFRNASLREAYQALGRIAGVNFIFDPQFQDQTITIDLKDVPFEEALTALASVGRTFYRVAESHIVNVIPDTPAKRRDYEQQVVRTFFLSNANLKETIDLLRVVLGARRVAPLPGANALTINDTPDKVAAAARIVDVVDKQRSEVVVEVEILEVNRSRLKDYGIEITSALPGVEGVVGAIFPKSTVTETTTDANGNPITTERPLTLNDNPYSKSQLVITGLPGVIYRLLKTDTSTRLLANPQLRTSDGATAQARFGDQIPVPITTFAPIATGGISQQPITSFEYKDVGVNIDITPRVHHDGDVTLTLKLEVSALGPPFQNLPTFNSRTVSSVIRLRDGETNILAGLISDTERKTITTIPGLGSIPVIGRIFSRNRTEGQETDIVMTSPAGAPRAPESPRPEPIRPPVLTPMPSPSPTPGP
jgi:general secretion pathway protein D